MKAYFAFHPPMICQGYAMPVSVNRLLFMNALRKALYNLHDPYELKKNPLNQVLAESLAESGGDLKQAVIGAINAVMPDIHTPHDSKAWRVYELLNYRFIDQIGQKEVAKTLLISLRTLQRMEPEAIEILAESMASAGHLSLLGDGDSESVRASSAESVGLTSSESWEKEAEIFKVKNATSLIDIRKMLKELSQILQPIRAAGPGSVRVEIPEDTWLVEGEVTLLRQAVLTAVSAFDRQNPGLQITISSRPAGPQGTGLQGIIEILGRNRRTDLAELNLSSGAEITAALTNLMQILNGSIEVQRRSAGEAAILLSLPARRQYSIVVVDDNADAIRLVEKYLAHSIYTVTGIQDPERVVAALQKDRPALVIMDVMLPNVDGWLLLSRIRRSAGIAKTPVIISTILPQEELSASLGADGFLRKPFTQLELLQALTTHLP
jgi:CheY-like chemotaxis protein